MAKPESRFPKLSARERAAVGTPGDYAWDEAVKEPARIRPETVQFSVRVDRDLFEGLQDVATRQDATFSDVVRFAIRNFVRNGGRSGLSNVVVTYGGGSLLVQLPGQRAEVPANRRFVGPDERIPSAGAQPVTAAST